MKVWKGALISLATGMVITLYTGLINTTPGEGFVGATWFGWPSSWLRSLVLAPGYYPYRIDTGNLAMDIVFWAIAVFIIWYIALQLSRNK